MANEEQVRDQLRSAMLRMDGLPRRDDRPRDREPDAGEFHEPDALAEHRRREQQSEHRREQENHRSRPTSSRWTSQ